MRGSPEPSRGSMQGTYVLTPAGECLGRINSRDVEAVARTLDGALAKWRKLGDAARRAGELPVPGHRWEHSYPENGLVLERFARDIGDDPTETPRRPVNRDAAWFSAEEARGMVPEPRVGATRTAPLVAERLARLALVDNVRGQTLPFSPAEVERAELQVEVVAVDGELLRLALRGSTRAEAKGPWLGGDNYWKPNREWPRWIDNRLSGRATYDAAAGRFVAFELVALGERRGRTTFNGRHREDAAATHRIGFLLRLAPPGWRVAPTFINVYGADWVAVPAPVAK